MGKSKEKDLRDWHRMFGLVLMDFFSGSPFKVEMELDMSLQKQLLDVLVTSVSSRATPALPKMSRNGTGMGK